MGQITPARPACQLSDRLPFLGIRHCRGGTSQSIQYVICTNYRLHCGGFLGRVITTSSLTLLRTPYCQGYLPFIGMYCNLYLYMII